MQKPTLKHWLLLGYLTLFWGFAFYLIAVGLEVFAPVTIVWGRLTLGAVFMLVVLRFRGGRLPREAIWWRRLLILSVTGNLLPFTLIAWAEQTVPSGEVGLLMALMPITILLLAHWFLEHEPLTPMRILGVVAGFAGVALLLGDDLFAGDEGRLPGQLAAVLATLAYAANGIYTKRLPAFDTVAISAGSLLVGACLLLTPMLMQQTWVAPTDAPSSWLAVLVLGVLATGLATWVYFTVVSEVGPGFLSTINYLIPGVAVLAGTLLLGEPSGWVQWLALACIIAGVWLIQPKAKQADAEI